VLADPLRQVGLCLHRTGAQRSGESLEHQAVWRMTVSR
jgi:hypothetical protein